MSPIQAGDWRKSSFSAEGDCVEWKYTSVGVDVRNSRFPSNGYLSFTNSEWQAFVSGVIAGEAQPPTAGSGLAD